jgi:hypothetical protein
LYIDGRSLEGFKSKLILNLIWPGLDWPLLAGGRCSEVAVNTALTVAIYTAKPVLKITCKKRPPVNNGHSEAITTSLKLTYH